MTFLKNIQFSHLIKIGANLKEFNFRKSNGSLETIFTVDTIDAKGNRIVFNMHNTGNEWKIIQQELPVWILANEDQLAASIQKELAVQEIYFVKPVEQQPHQLSKLLQLLGIV
ncbi:MAG: hypothetical protein QM737_20055 [Ferruginibacter sp.]